MKFTLKNSINSPSRDRELNYWWFAADLRNYFPKLESNHEITAELSRRKVVTRNDDVDPESSCTYIYFKTKLAAKSFLVRLNALSEVANFVEPKPLPGDLVGMTKTEWLRMKVYIEATLTTEQMAGLKKISPTVFELGDVPGFYQ